MAISNFEDLNEKVKPGSKGSPGSFGLKKSLRVNWSQSWSKWGQKVTRDYLRSKLSVVKQLLKVIWGQKLRWPRGKSGLFEVKVGQIKGYSGTFSAETGRVGVKGLLRVIEVKTFGGQKLGSFEVTRGHLPERSLVRLIVSQQEFVKLTSEPAEWLWHSFEISRI